MYNWLEVVKGETSYWVMGYIAVFGGPFDTEEQAQKFKRHLVKKWHIQRKS